MRKRDWICIVGTVVLFVSVMVNAESVASYVKTYEVTGYCPCKICCGKYAKLGPNRKLSGGKRLSSLVDEGFVAGPPSMKFGTKLTVPGYKGGKVVRCEDRGGAIKGDRLDLFFKTHKEAKKWGRQKNVKVTIYKE